MIKPFSAVCVQPEIHAAYERADIKKNLERYLNLIDHIMMWWSMSLPVKLIALPEFCLQGTQGPYPPRRLERFLGVAVPMPGEEIDMLAQKAKEAEIYIAGAALELDENWPARYFNTAFVLSPEGKIILKYRKLNTTNWGGELATSPHDIYDEYVRIYGKDSLFPVVKTEIGNLGCFICYDGTFPEVARALALKGAEILIRPTAWMAPWLDEPLDLWTLLNRARAFENRCYLVAPNWGSVKGASWPSAGWGNSQVIDFNGAIISQVRAAGEDVSVADVDIELLRETRKRIFFNLLPQLRADLFADIYKEPIYPRNQQLEKPAQVVPELWQFNKSAMEKFYKKIYTDDYEVDMPKFTDYYKKS